MIMCACVCVCMCVCVGRSVLIIRDSVTSLFNSAFTWSISITPTSFGTVLGTFGGDLRLMDGLVMVLLWSFFAGDGNGEKSSGVGDLTAFS